MIRRKPRYPLSQYVRLLWATESADNVEAPTPEIADGQERPGAESNSPKPNREIILPTGLTHIAIRLQGPPLRTFSSIADSVGRKHSMAVVGGPRLEGYVRQIGVACESVGIQFEPAAGKLFDPIPLFAIAHSHTDLEELWPGQTEKLMEGLGSIDSAEGRLQFLEQYLLRRIFGSGRSIDTESDLFRNIVSGALTSVREGRTPSVRQMVESSGRSHRHFIAMFRRHVGLSPSDFMGVQRFAASIELASLSLSEQALAAGYSDQAHMCREFKRHSSITPRQYQKGGSVYPFHFPLGR